MQRWSRAAGQLFQAEVEKAVVQGLTAAFRTLADRLPQVVAEIQQRQTPPPASCVPELPRVLRIPIEDTKTADQTVEQPAPAETTIADADKAKTSASAAVEEKLPARRERAAARDRHSAAPSPKPAPPPRGAGGTPALRGRSESSRSTRSPPVDPKDSARPTASRPSAPRPPRDRPPAGRTTTHQTAPTLLPLNCPGCGASARISWNRLDRLFRCRKCMRLFRVNREGHLTEIDPNPRRSRRPRRIKGGAVSAAALVLLFLVAICLYPRFRHKPALAELPNDLAARSELWGKAWLNRDRLLLRRLTSLTHDRQLHPWLIRHAPPPRPEQETPTPPTIQLRIHKTRPRQAVVFLRITTAARKTLRQFRLDWVQRGDAWYFVPSLRH